ncbi:MAG: 4Fe-4S dicluster domain-containing protein [Candidatus Firestonebacteria bacterium]
MKWIILKDTDKKITGEVEKISGQVVANCYQCGKCTAGCPLAYAMDLGPTRFIRILQLGVTEEIKKSNTPWFCISCETCTTRCPREIDIAKLMDATRIVSQNGEFKPRELRIAIFDKIFTKLVEVFGRPPEFLLGALNNALTFNLFKDVLLFPKMFIKGKLPISFSRVNSKAVQQIFEKSKSR